MTQHRTAFDIEAVLKADRWMEQLSRSLAGNRTDAEDIKQDAWLACLRSRPSSSLIHSKPWLYRVVSNLVKRYQRDSRRRRRRELATARPGHHATLPQESMRRLELRRQVLQAVNDLQDPYRSVIVLRFLEGMPLKKIAHVEGIPVNTVKSRLSRALALLRRRLDGRYGTKSAWSLLLLSFHPAAGVSRTGTSATTAFLSFLNQKGVLFMSLKSIVSATCASLIVVLGIGIVLHRADTERQSASTPQNSALLSARSAGGPTQPNGSPIESNSHAASGMHNAAGPGQSPFEDTHRANPAADTAESPDPLPPEHPKQAEQSQASEETLAARKAYADLRKVFGDGGGEGWKNVGKQIGSLQEILLDSDDGFEEFLLLLDQEADASFLEALMHHYALAKTELHEEAVRDTELQEEIWARFKADEDPSRRMAFLRFFAYNRKLSSSHMDDFMKIAKTDPSYIVRQVSIDAIASNRPLLEDTWETLAHVVEHDPAAVCRETGIYGLAFVDTGRAAELVNAALSSPDENMRAAALKSEAGGTLPDEITGGDITTYLVSEFRTATSNEYKKALGERLYEHSPQILEEEIRRALPTEKDFSVRREYKLALEKLAGSRAAEDSGNAAAE